MDKNVCDNTLVFGNLSILDVHASGMEVKEI